MAAADTMYDDPAPTNRVWTVSELNRIVKDLLEQSLMPFWLSAEIGNLTIHRSGHVYLTLKDERAQVRAVFFRGAETARQMGLATGKAIEVWGRLGVYEPRGEYQVIISRMRAKGVGDLQQRFEELKERLRAEGLFDEERKRAIPLLPKCVGVVTSPEGAALRDFLHILEQRFAEMHVRIVPVAVQGEQAARQIAQAIRYLNETAGCDVIVVTRGGGSLEDLWPFNEEVVARAVFSSGIPVISAVGHERDFSIADFVADLRVATPSAAAERVIAGKADLQEHLRNQRRRLIHALGFLLSRLRRRCERASRSAVFHEPLSLLRLYAQRLDDLSLRLCRGLRGTLGKRYEAYARLSGHLRILNPGNVLERGYAILLDEASGRLIRRPEETHTGAALRGILHGGELGLTVREQRPPERDGDVRNE